MGRFKYLNATEIRSEIEKFGSEDEREIISKICVDPNWDDCPNCDDYQRDAESAADDADEANNSLDEIRTLIEDDEMTNDDKVERIAGIVS